MTTIYLQRQGVSHTLRTSIHGRFHATYYGSRLEVLRHEPSDRPDWPGKWLIHHQQENVRPDQVRDILADMFDVEVAAETEAYMHYSPKDREIWPYIADDVYRTCARYQPGTDTIRHAMSNICLIAWRNGEPCFDTDAASEPYRAICERAHAEYLKPHNQQQGELEAKRWLAWLIGEYIKDELGEQPVTIQPADF